MGISKKKKKVITSSYLWPMLFEIREVVSEFYPSKFKEKTEHGKIKRVWAAGPSQHIVFRLNEFVRE